MTILINGTTTDTTVTDLAQLLDSLGHAPDSVATAVNGDFVARALRADYTLRDGDRVDVIAPMAGG